MQRIKFLDRMISGKLTRREMMQGAAAFGVGTLTMPRLPQAAEVLTCLEWSGYELPEYYKPYIAKHGAPPNFSIFTGEEEALQKVRAGFAADIMHPCNYSVGRFVKAGIAAPVDTSKLSHWNDLFPALQTAAGVLIDAKVMMVPADWGDSNVVYRPDLVDDDFKQNESWGILYDDKYAGKVSMLDDTVAILIAARLMGLSVDQVYSMTDEQLAATRPLVEKTVKNSRFLWATATDMQQALASGEIVAAYAWNDTVRNLKSQGIPIAFAQPKEQYWTWYCGMTLLNTGKADVNAAHDFIDAWISPETGKYLIEGSGYGHANVKSFEIADKTILADLGFHDPIEHINKGILFRPTSDELTEKLTKMWEEVKALKQ
jgi:spermidine/putrescine-binding protein